MKRKLLPQLQRAALDALLKNGELGGKDFRVSLALRGYKVYGPAFYQLMKRMEERKLVTSWITQVVVNGHGVRIKNYKITATGAKRLEETMKVIRGRKK